MFAESCLRVFIDIFAFLAFAYLTAVVMPVVLGMFTKKKDKHAKFCATSRHCTDHHNSLFNTVVQSGTGGNVLYLVLSYSNSASQSRSVKFASTVSRRSTCTSESESSLTESMSYEEIEAVSTEIFSTSDFQKLVQEIRASIKTAGLPVRACKYFALMHDIAMEVTNNYFSKTVI